MNRWYMASVAILLLTTATAVGQELVQKPLSPAAKKVLRQAVNYELFSLNPQLGKGAGVRGKFYGYDILGKVMLKQKQTRQAVTTSLLKAMSDKVPVAKCFLPRHGIRAVHKGKVVDLVICFQCSSVHIYENLQRKSYMPIGRAPKALLNKILKRANVRIAK